MKKTDVSALLSLRTIGFSKPIKDRLLRIPNGLNNLLLFAQSARSGDQEPMGMTIPGGEMLMEWEDSAVRFSVDFSSKGNLIAELDEDQLTFHGHEMPTALAVRHSGHNLDDFISLPDQMSDLGRIEVLSISPIQNGFQMMLKNPSLTLESKDIRENESESGCA